MTQIIQVKRRIGGAPGAPTAGTLQAGELAFNNADNALYVGADAGGTVVPLVHNQRQLEIHPTSPAQTIQGGIKTVDAALLKITGGNPGEMLVTTNVDGTLDFVPAVSAAQQFVGSFSGATGVVTGTAVSGVGPGLPAAGPTNNGYYVIADAAGATPPAGSGVAGPFDVGDWIISNGTIWTHLNFGGVAVSTAADVGVAPVVMGGDDVQEVLETMAATFVSGPAASVADNIATFTDATGLIIKDSGTLLSSLATVGYVDTENTAQEAAQDTRDDAQDVLIAANATAIAGQAGIDAAQDTVINNKITKPVSVLAIGNIATYADLTGGVALDGGKSIADIDAAIAAKADAATAGDVKGPASVAADGNIAVYDALTGKLIKDGGMTIAAIQTAAGDVKGPAAAVVDSNLAAYDTTTGKLIKDSGSSVATLNAAIAARGDVFSTAPIALANNLAAFSDVGGKMIIDSGQSITSIQTYVDTAINNIPGATPPDVLEPDLTGDGTASLPITWTGVKFDALNVPASFTGLGTTASPLSLVLVDGGTF